MFIPVTVNALPDGSPALTIPIKADVSEGSMVPERFRERPVILPSGSETVLLRNAADKTLIHGANTVIGT